ncbi:MAG: sigma-70 family RNA polymerase sigma factor [Saprospiraceae bacterium]|nr:sigma-70 family RNA polymerase sigma factor [Saprospiraceae bacterium]
MTDEQLWSELIKGNQKALGQIYDLHADSLIRYGRRFTDDLTVIEDCIHDLFVNIWKNKSGLSMTNSIIKYLCVALRRDIIRRINQSHSTISTVSLEDVSFNSTISAEDIIINEESSAEDGVRLKNAFKILSSRQKEAVYLRYYEELDYEQICEIMDINYQSVRNLISKAIIQMRENFAFWFTFLIFQGGL